MATGRFANARPSAKNAPEVRSARRSEMEYLVEYGLSDSVTLLFSPRAGSLAEGGFRGSLADVTRLAQQAQMLDMSASGQLGARVRLWRDDRSVVSLQATARAGVFLDNMETQRLRRATEAEARLMWFRSFTLADRPWFIDLQGGYRHGRVGASGGQADASYGEFLFDATLGVHVTPRLMLLAQHFSVMSVGGSGRYASHKVQLSAAWRISQAWTVQAGVLAAYAGENAWREQGVMFSVWRRFGM